MGEIPWTSALNVAGASASGRPGYLLVSLMRGSGVRERVRFLRDVS